MLAEICDSIHNYFEVDPATGKQMIYPGTYTISGGGIALPFMKSGQYFRVFGSESNDGIHAYPADDMEDEVFTGVIWKMRVPKEFLALVAEIESWMDKYGDVMRNPYQSEDVIGVTRYTKMTTGKVTGDYIATWQNAYKDRLKKWRNIA